VLNVPIGVTDRHHYIFVQEALSIYIFSQVLLLLRVRFLRYFFVGNFFSNIIFLVLAIKGQLMVSTLPERTNFLDVSGAQGSHPKTGLSNIGKTHLCP
jgi:hypothetical protein